MRSTTAVLRLLICGLMLAALATAGSGDVLPPKLRIGDKAPRLTGLDWVQGKKINSFKRGTVYVLDFWVDSIDCRRGIRYLNTLADHYPGESLEVIGIGVAYYDQLPPVEEILAWLGDGMSYKVATDPKGRSYEAFLVNGGCETYYVPVTMVIDARGKLAWIGRADGSLNHGLEDCLNDLFADSWDDGSARAAFEADRAERLLAEGRMSFVREQMYEAFNEERDAEALGYCQRLVESHPKNEGWRMRCYSLLRNLGRLEEAREEALVYLDGPNGQDVSKLVEMAYRLGASEHTRSGQPADLDLGLMAAERAVALDGRRDPEPLRMLALVHSVREEWSQAVTLQAEALGLARESEQDEMRAVLDEYRAQAARLEAQEPDELQGAALSDPTSSTRRSHAVR